MVASDANMIPKGMHPVPTQTRTSSSFTFARKKSIFSEISVFDVKQRHPPGITDGGTSQCSFCAAQSPCSSVVWKIHCGHKVVTTWYGSAFVCFLLRLKNKTNWKCFGQPLGAASEYCRNLQVLRRATTLCCGFTWLKQENEISIQF